MKKILQIVKEWYTMIRSDKELLAGLTMDDLQEQHKLIAEAVGVQGLKKLTDIFGGTALYIPQKKELVKNKVYSMILADYDGTNIRELAVAYGVSESTVYNIVRDKIVKGSAKKQIPGQMNFADIGI